MRRPVDKADRSVRASFAMWTSPVLLGAAAALLVACSSNTPPPVTPEPTPSEAAPAATTEAPAEELANEEPPPPPPPAEPADAAPKRVEPREITPRDCDALGQQLARVTLSDQLAALPEKLSAEKRRATEESFTEVANKVGERWADSCRGSLVGGFTDDASVKCAMRSKTVREFETCINGPAPTK